MALQFIATRLVAATGGKVVFEAVYVIPAHMEQDLVQFTLDTLHPNEVATRRIGGFFDSPALAAHAAVEYGLLEGLSIILWQAEGKRVPWDGPEVKKRFTATDKINELRRELGLRHKLYPKWVDQGSLTREQADYRIDVLKEVIEDYEAIATAQQPQFDLGLELFPEVQ